MTKINRNIAFLPLNCCRQWLLLIFVFTIGILTLPAVYYNVGDPYACREEARALVMHGRLSVEHDVAENFPDKGAFFVHNVSNGKWYSRYGSFNGIINAVPILAEWVMTGEAPPLTSPDRVFYLGVYFAFQATIIAWLLYQITGFYSQNIKARIAYVLLAFYTTYLWNYLRSTTSESIQLLLFCLCIYFFVRFERVPGSVAERPRKYLYLMWTALLLLCQTKISYLTVLPVFVIILGLMVFLHPMKKTARLLFILEGIIAPLAIIAFAQGVMLTMKFGSPFLSGYHQFPDPYFPHTFWSATADFLWNWQGSIFVHFPLLILACLTMRRFFRTHSLHAWLIWGCFFATYILVARAGGPSRGELAYGPRYFVVFLPLLALPALYPLEWIFSASPTLLRWAARASLAAIVVFLVYAQMLINRMDYFFKYEIAIQFEREGQEVSYNKHIPPTMNRYFAETNFAKINWDHLQSRGGHWERLPYYSDILKHTNPENLARWKEFIAKNISASNLYWFPDINQ